jgi:hypothetical protein
MVLPMVATACGDPDARSASEASLEYKLAVLQKGGYVSDDDPMMRRFAGVLDRLEAKCPESRQQLADMGVRGRELLSNSGLNEPLLTVFENWQAAIPDTNEDGGVGPCADVLAIYVTLRGGR